MMASTQGRCVSSAHPDDGEPSPRCYTRAEMAAAVRIGLARWDHGNAGGPIFWATGPYHPSEARRNASDWALVSEAMDREWGRL